MSKSKLPYADARALAMHLVSLLKPGCERIIIAGSIRRQKPEIGDIELVAMPMLEPVCDLFGMPVEGMERSGLDERLASLRPVYTKNGAKYKQFAFEGVSVDLFIASAETWGCVSTIRTGSADFTRWLVTNRRHGGGCPSHLKFNEGRIFNGSTPLDTSEERLVFEALEQPWIEPVERIEGRWIR